MTDHTGPNTRPGGCHGGLLSRRYQRLLSTGVVAAAPIPAVPATAPRMSAASRPLRPDGRDSAADTVAMFLTLPPSLSDPEPTQPDPSRIRSGADENPWLAPAPAVALSLGDRSGDQITVTAIGVTEQRVPRSVAVDDAVARDD